VSLLLQIQEIFWRKCTPEGVPLYLKNLISLINKVTLFDKVLILSFIRLYRSLESPLVINTKTITDSLKKDSILSLELVTKEISSNWKVLGSNLSFSGTKLTSNIDHRFKFTPGSLRIGNWITSGPIGKGPQRILIELIVLNRDKEILEIIDLFIQEFRKLIKFGPSFGITSPKDLINWLGSDKLEEVSSFTVFSKIFSKKQGGSLRTLSWFSDGIGKVRIIALADWISQSVLSPLHHVIFSKLKKLSTDYTHDQTSSIKIAKLWYQDGKQVWCFDLSAATDRIPISLQRKILNLCGLSEIGCKAWEFIMTERPFLAPNSKYYKYSVGQGIGLYSSWSTIAYTHHILVRLAALRNNIHNFQDYIILGDDVAIANKSVAEEYTKIIKALGIDISIPKSIIPHDGYNSWEFASKLMLNGDNISPLPLGLLLLGEFQSFITFCTNLLTTMSNCSVNRPFRQLVEIIAPNWDLLNPNLSGPFKVGSLKLEDSKGLTLEHFLTIFGIFSGLIYFRRNYTKELQTGQHLYRRQLNEIHSTSPFLDEDLGSYLNDMPLHYWISLDKGISTLTQKLFQQAAFQVNTLAFDHNPLIEAWTKSINLKGEELEKITAFSEFWILVSSPFIRAETEISDKLAVYYNSFSSGHMVTPLSGISIIPLLQKDIDPTLEFPLEFLGEIMLLARGPISLISRDKGLLAANSPLDFNKNISSHFTCKMLIRVLKKDFKIPFNVPKKFYKGMPLANKNR
jgi:hypothetical protein